MFADLDERQREQVWGFTLPLAAARCAGRRRWSPARSVFWSNGSRTAPCRASRLSEARSRRAAVQAFPPQVAALAAPLQRFLDAAFAATGYEIATGVARCLSHAAERRPAPRSIACWSTCSAASASRRAVPGVGRQPQLLSHPPAAQGRLRRGARWSAGRAGSSDVSAVGRHSPGASAGLAVLLLSGRLALGLSASRSPRVRTYAGDQANRSPSSAGHLSSEDRSMCRRSCRRCRRPKR